MRQDALMDFSSGLSAFLPGSRTAIIQTNSLNIFKTDIEPVSVVIPDLPKAPRVVPWGENNDLPLLLEQKVSKSPFMSQNMLFNILAGYGDGIMPVRRIVENNMVSFVPFEGNTEVRRFFEENNLPLYLLEQLTDLNWFYNVFPEVILNQENGSKRKIVEIYSKEASFSRWSEMESSGLDKGRILWHYYYAKWGEAQPKDGEVTATPVLDPHAPVRHLRSIMADDVNKPVRSRRNRFIVPVSLPTPGRPYYQKPYWFSLIESGIYDFALKIPQFKNALLDNQATIKYVVELGPGYFEDVFRREKISNDKEKEKRVKKEYADIDKFLKDVKNTGKSIITFQKLDPQGKPYPMLSIKHIADEFKGGEYIADLEEVANIMAYAQGVHPSLVGAAPGKTKTINGTEARELFILKQAIIKPLRDLLLSPFYLIKAINAWPEDLFFTIPNIELTTLDANKSGQQTVIPQTT
jgi:hypothetical protein